MSGSSAIRINIPRDFSTTPGARKRENGPDSGQEFREEYLEQHFADPTLTYEVHLEFDGALGYPTSFLEEAFGGLVRVYPEQRHSIMSRLRLHCTQDPFLIDEVKNYITEA